MSHVNISNVSKPKLLAALYNASKPLGLGFLHYTPEEMTEQENKEIREIYKKALVQGQPQTEIIKLVTARFPKTHSGLSWNIRRIKGAIGNLQQRERMLRKKEQKTKKKAAAPMLNLEVDMTPLSQTEETISVVLLKVRATELKQVLSGILQ